MRKRINIGVYIGQYDTDVAAWFNLLQDNHMSRAKCIMALLCSYAMKQKLPIGTIDINAPLIKNPVGPAPSGELLFGAGNSQAETIKRDRYGYGWQIRGPHREFIQGSVINVSVSRAEILSIVEESWKNGHHLATFLKALIRDNLEYGDQAIPPKMEDLQKACSAYLVLQNSKSISSPDDAYPLIRKRRKDFKKSSVGAESKGEPTAESMPRQRKGSPEHMKPLPDKPNSTPKTFKFTDDSDVLPEPTAQPVSKQAKNPLLGQI